jgi:hypothetical protein
MDSCLYSKNSNSFVWYTFEVVKLLKKIVYIVSSPTVVINVAY